MSESSPGIGFGQRCAHSSASSIERTSHIQKPATSSLVSANGPSVTVRCLPEKCTPAPASRMPALASCSLNSPISRKSSSEGITPFSEFGLALTKTMTRMTCSWGVVGLGSYDTNDERRDRESTRSGDFIRRSKKEDGGPGAAVEWCLSRSDYFFGGAPAASLAACLA